MRLRSATAALFCACGLMLVPATVQAQKTTITATGLKMGGIAIPAGTVTLTPTNAQNYAIGIVSADADLGGPQGYLCAIAAGTITGTCQVPDQATAHATAPNTPLFYRVDIYNSAAKTTANPYGGYTTTLTGVTGVTGASWALNAYTPTNTVTLSATGLSTGTTVPTRCNEPAIFQRKPAPLRRYSCVGSVFVEDASSGGGASLPATAALLKGDGAGGAVAATAGTDYATASVVAAHTASINTLSTAAGLAAIIKTQTGCNTAGYVWQPASNTCVAQSSSSGGSGGAVRGSSIFLGDQALGTENGANTVAGVSAGGKLTAGANGNGGQNNVLIGHNVAPNGTTLRESTIIGDAAAYSLVGGGNGDVEDTILTCVGSQACASLTTGTLGSVMMGQKAGITATQSYEDVIVGTHGGSGIGTSTGTVMMGGFAGDGANLGNTNPYALLDEVVIGHRAMSEPLDSTLKQYDVAIGALSMKHAQHSVGNVMLGYDTGEYLSTGQFNVGVGYQAFQGAHGGTNTPLTGLRNVGIGYQSGLGCSSCADNIFLGTASGYEVSTGHDNFFAGVSAGAGMGAGNYNVLIGAGIGGHSGTDEMVAIGHLAGTGANGEVFIGPRAGRNNTTGSGNTYIGYNAGIQLQTSTNNTMIGYGAGGNLHNNESGDVLLGTYATTADNCSNTIQLGSGSNGTCGSVQAFDRPLQDAAGYALSKGIRLYPVRTFHITTDGTSTDINVPIGASMPPDSYFSFGATNATAASNMTGVYLRDKYGSNFVIKVPAVAGMTFDVTMVAVY